MKPQLHATGATHVLVKEGVFEGVPTVTALFGVLPEVVASEHQDADPEARAALCGTLLPSTRNMAQLLARHSRGAGNSRFIMNACTPDSLMPNGKDIRYNNLSYRPDAFTTQLNNTGESRTLHAVTDNRNPVDLDTFFTGCPAIAGGSVTYLVGLIERRIEEEACYERAFDLSAATPGRLAS